MILLGIILGLVLILGAIIYSSLSWGWVMFKFYTWFLLPVFVTLPEITYSYAIGLVLFTTLLKYQHVDTIKDEYKDNNKIFVSLAYPWITLLFGWIIYKWFII